jgi:hypothetical protein
MSDPKNHHWLPRFLLREWADGSTGKVMCFYRPHGRVVASRQGTRRIGATEWLYTAGWSGYEAPNFVETSFMAKAIDTPAARLHRRMLNGEISAFGFEERQLWVWFVLLLLVRHPGMIRARQDAQEEHWKKFFIEYLIGQTPTGYTLPLDHAGAEAFYDQHFAGSGRDLVLQAAVNYPRESPFYPDIMRLEWRVLRLSKSAIHFLLADNPITMWGDEHIKRLWMPLAPDALFVAGDHDYLSKAVELRERYRESLALDVMRHQCRQAREFVIGKDEGEEKNRTLASIAEQYLPARPPSL